MPKFTGGTKSKAMKTPPVDPELSLHTSDDGEQSDHEEDSTQLSQPTQQEKIPEESCLKKVKRTKLVMKKKTLSNG